MLISLPSKWHYPLAALFFCMCSAPAISATNSIGGTFSCITAENIEIGLNEHGKKYEKKLKTGNLFQIQYELINRSYREPEITISSSSAAGTDTPFIFFRTTPKDLKLESPDTIAHATNRTTFLLWEYGLMLPGLTLGTNNDSKGWQAASSFNGSYGIDMSVIATLSKCHTDRLEYGLFKKAIFEAVSKKK